MTKSEQKLEIIVASVMLLLTITGALFARYIYELPAPKRQEISSTHEKL